MARLFNGSTNFITAPAGAFSGAPFTYGTLAIIIRWTALPGDWKEFYSNAPASGDMFFGVDTSNYWQCTFGSGTNTRTNLVTITAGVWLCAIISKDTGSVFPRLNLYNYNTGAWSTNVFDVVQPDGAGNMGTHYIGSYHGSFEFVNADIAALGLFRTVVPASDAEAQNWGLPFSRLAWLALAGRADRSAVWLLDQAATTTPVLDLTGGGANESGGTVPAISTNSVPLLGYGAPVLSPSPTAAAVAYSPNDSRYLYTTASQHAASW